MYLFSPYDVEREYGVPFSYVDITKEYDKMVANDSIRKKKLPARELETEIGKLQQSLVIPTLLILIRLTGIILLMAASL